MQRKLGRMNKTSSRCAFCGLSVLFRDPTSKQRVFTITGSPLSILATFSEGLGVFSYSLIGMKQTITPISTDK